jgi:hypothetical protein
MDTVHKIRDVGMNWHECMNHELKIEMPKLLCYNTVLVEGEGGN